MNPAPAAAYRADIDGLRAISIIAVVIFHAFPAVLPAGFIGVDIFFVISGYLITGIILRGSHDGRFSLLAFYRRRVQRLLPALLPVLLFCLVAGYFALLPFEYASLGRHTAASSVFVPNLLFWTEAGYFDADSKLKPLLHLWSLGVEEQFYLTWPLLLLVAARIGLSAGVVVAGLLLVSFGLSIIFTGDQAASFFLPWFRAWELLLGGWLAWLQQRHGARTGAAALPLALVGLLLLCFALGLIDQQSGFPVGWALLPTLAAVLLIAAGPDTSVNRTLAQPALVFIGKISFPLYLWHWPLLSFARIMEAGEPSPAIRGAAVGISVLLAAASYRLLEMPLRYHPSRLVPLSLLGGMLLLGAAGLAVTRLDGLPGRTAALNDAASVLYWEELGLHERDDCSATLGVPGRCLSDGKPAQVVALGDSHSTNTFFALAHHYRDTPVGVMRLGEGGCPPLYRMEVRAGGNADHCLAATTGNLHWAAKTPGVETVYLSSMGPMYVNPRQQNYRMRSVDHPNMNDNRALFATGLQAAIDYLQSAGKTVVLVIDWPAMDTDPARCIDIRPLRLTPFEADDCAINRVRHDKRSRVYREVIGQVLAANPGLAYWDTAEAFCDAKRCRGMVDGELLYRDRSHLSMAGTRFLGERLRLDTAPVPGPAN